MISKSMVSNYEKMKDSMAGKFLQYDQEEIIQKFLLEHDSKYIYIQFVGRRYRINRLTGAISWSKDHFQTEEKAGYNEAMTIYDVLCYSKKNCHLANEWVNIVIDTFTLKHHRTFGISLAGCCQSYRLTIQMKPVRRKPSRIPSTPEDIS